MRINLLELLHIVEVHLNEKTRANQIYLVCNAENDIRMPNDDDSGQ